MASKKERALAAARAAKRLPIAGTTVVLLPVVDALGLASGQPMNLATAKTVVKRIMQNFTGFDENSGKFDGSIAVRTYGPIVVYLLARRFAGKHISSVLRPLGLRF